MHRKIDIFLFNRTHNIWQYECSTNQSKTCKEAKAKYMARFGGLDDKQVKCSFAR
jgi:hypothetical protein